MFCRKCGKEFEGNFCPDCGTPVIDNHSVSREINNTISNIDYTEFSHKKIKKGTNRTSILILFVFVFIIAIIKTFSNSNFNFASDEDAYTSNLEDNVIVDVSSFSKISAKDLKSMLGKPDDRVEWTNKTSKGNFDVVTYSYDIDNIHYEFIFVNNAVIRLSLYSEKNWTGSGEYFKYEKRNKEDTLTLFGITPNDNSKITSDTGYAFRVSPVSESVADFWITAIDSDTKTFGSVKVTYNSNYFD